MRRFIFLIIVIAVATTSCNTKYDSINTGKAKAHFDGNMYEYLQSNSYDWDSIRVMIERAGMVDLFEGKVAGYEKFTFLGVTNHSIRRWLIKQHPDFVPYPPNGTIALQISDLTVANCREFVEMHIIKGENILLEDVPVGSYRYDGWMVIGVDGSKLVKTVAGNEFLMWKIRLPYEGIVGAGAEVMKVWAYNSGNNTFGLEMEIASTNIQPDNGVVQALHYAYEPAITAELVP